MTERGRYKTKHHESVREVLLNNPSRCYTVDSLCELLNEEGHHIGRTTVYRQLEKMAADGEALKYLYQISKDHGADMTMIRSASAAKAAISTCI